jgi:outer membrane murein-binding lipoprotein Lpp
MCCSKNQLGIVAGCYRLLISSNQISVGYQVKALQAQVEQEQQKKSALQSEVGLVSSEVAHLRAREAQLTHEVIQLREGKKSVEEELHKVKAARSVDSLQMKELQDQLEAEQYFSVCFLIGIVCLL